MIEVRELRGVPLREALDVLLDARVTRQLAEVQEAVAILHIVENYHRDLPASPLPGRGRLVELAAEGGPMLNEFVPLELSAALGVSQQSITLLIGDLLDLRHRHPLLWGQVRTGRVPLWQARKIVQRVATADLGWQAARELDRQLTPTLPGLTVGRALKLLEGLITAIDPRAAEERAEAQRRQRWVRIQPGADGVSWLDGTLSGADGRHLDGTLNRIAAMLQATGDTDNRDARRSTALGILANPALALTLLHQHQQRRATERDRNRAAGTGCTGQAATDPTASDTVQADTPTAAVSGHQASTEESAAALNADLTAGVPAGLLAELAGIDVTRLLPASTLFVHISDQAIRSGRGAARIEGIGPVPVTQLRHLLKGTRVRVLPVFDPGAVTPVDSYEIPAPLRRAVLLRHPTDTFPFGSWPSRNLDLDHLQPYHPDAGPGQTSVEGLQPLTRRAHRAKTHGNWQVQPDPHQGQFWRSPLGLTYRVLPDGRTVRVRGEDEARERARSGTVSHVRASAGPVSVDFPISSGTSSG